jgi:hypothetical protein
MASVLYNGAMLNEAKGLINFASDTFKVMLVTAAYTPDAELHDYRNDVTNEVAGTGYTAGGKTSAVTVAKASGNRVGITFAAVTWATATIANARGAVIYKSRGGAASADELVAYVDFGSDKSSSGGDFGVTFSNPIYKTAA